MAKTITNTDMFGEEIEVEIVSYGTTPMRTQEI